jgi:hypothetical protein
METTLSQPPMAAAKQRISTPRRVGLVMTYNQRETCIEAINSLLVQTLALDLIIVSDDCSTDGTYGVITDHFSKNGKPSNVELYQSEKNLGFIPHFNALLKNHCRDDDLIFYNAGDDISETSRVEEFYREYVAKGKPRYFLGHSYVTSFGSGAEEILVPPIESIKENRELCLIASAYHIGASQVFTSALFFDFGPILFDDCYEDLTLGYRALLKNAYHFIPKALLRYRSGGLSNWQKNPLEKKRGRLRSTLTQRAIDSMRSGNFDALATIQDCYSQYGFSHTPHLNRIRVTIISDDVLNPRQYTYSISDHFHLISNICEIQRESSENFLDSINYPQTRNRSQSDIVWLVASRIIPKNLETILNKTVFLKDTSFVIDFGLITSLQTALPKFSMTELAKKFSSDFTNTSIHTGSNHLYNVLSQNRALSRITYLPPLQNIDGPDEIRKPSREKRGLLVALDNADQLTTTLSIVRQAFSTTESNLNRLHPVHLSLIETDMLINDQVGSELENAHPEDPIELKNYDFLVILGDDRSENSSLLQFWWSLSAKHCIPVFINSNAPRFHGLTHGQNCLLVDSNIAAWSTAIKLIHLGYDSLQTLATRARRDLYFNFSAQKRTKDISDILGTSCRKYRFFDKFLPL